jgi:hypothetical protein
MEKLIDLFCHAMRLAGGACDFAARSRDDRLAQASPSQRTRRTEISCRYVVE